MDHVVRPVEPAELRRALALFSAALLVGSPRDASVAAAEESFEPGRHLALHDGPDIVGTTWSFGCRMSVPGGSVVSAAGVSKVGVRADRTRRGFLSALMRAQLTDLAERGEILAQLRATEGGIYGRFGYGVASRGRAVRLRRAGGHGFRGQATAGGDVRMVPLTDPRAELLELLPPLHDRIALQRPGSITRPLGWWTAQFARVDAEQHLLVAVHSGLDGDDGFVVAKAPMSEPFDERVLQVEDFYAADVAATAGLWRFLLGLDLVGSVEAHLRPLDEPLELLLDNPRDLTTTGVEDEVWLRLVDVPAALAARSYGSAEPVTVAVHDRLLESNTGVYRVAGGTAERVGPLGGPAQPELQCGVEGLAMAYLGDRRPSQLLAAGWWQGDPAAALRADAAFAIGEPAPWCGTYF